MGVSHVRIQGARPVSPVDAEAPDKTEGDKMSSLNIDIDIDIAELNATGRDRRAHPGSDFPSTLVDNDRPVVASESTKLDAGNKFPAYHKYWDAELQAYKCLNAFVAQNPGWLPEFAGVALAGGRVLPQRMTQAQLNDQVTAMLDRVKDRGSRASEIINQDGADGAISCWLNLLAIDPVRNPATNLLVRVGRRVGEHVVMCLKDEFKSPRPSQLCLALYPLIDAPATPSFPAGHALQAYLISYLLADSLPSLPQHAMAMTDLENATGLLFDIAARVSDNRVVAGIHYPVDIAAGKAVAIACFEKLRTLGDVVTLQGGVREEFSQYA
jgi:hypothetical protein